MSTSFAISKLLGFSSTFSPGMEFQMHATIPNFTMWELEHQSQVLVYGQ